MREKSTIGTLAYGSLINDPGNEVEPEICEKILNVTTPFKIEFARKSRTRACFLSASQQRETENDHT